MWRLIRLSESVRAKKIVDRLRPELNITVEKDIIRIVKET